MWLLILTLISNIFKSENFLKQGVCTSWITGHSSWEKSINHYEPKSLTGVGKGVETQTMPCYYLMMYHKSIMEIILGPHLFLWHFGLATISSLELVTCQHEEKEYGLQLTQLLHCQEKKKNSGWREWKANIVVKYHDMWYSSRIRCFSHAVALKVWKEALEEGRRLLERYPNQKWAELPCIPANSQRQ